MGRNTNRKPIKNEFIERRNIRAMNLFPGLTTPFVPASRIIDRPPEISAISRFRLISTRCARLSELILVVVYFPHSPCLTGHGHFFSFLNNPRLFYIHYLLASRVVFLSRPSSEPTSLVSYKYPPSSLGASTNLKVHPPTVHTSHPSHLRQRQADCASD